MNLVQAILTGLGSLRPLTRREIEEKYLAASTDLADLERRMRDIDRGALRQPWSVVEGYRHV